MTPASVDGERDETWMDYVRPCDVQPWKATMQHAVRPGGTMETDISLADPMGTNSTSLIWSSAVEDNGGKELV
ncbi:hypothetical protein Q5P01_025876 [Channa striata]|uniref:Uncharacterized protein n=1 Tax=Channa striata TaxID=64152 RepID=A0AA88IMR6_CHASR|nr:hypothetical protein Q5P01_025876 [Channa striata]